MKIAYVLKRYPRFSETFVVSEILAHEAAGLEIAIFALRPPVDAHFQDIIAQVKAPVEYFLSYSLTGSQFWATVQAGAQRLPDLWSRLAYAQGENAHDLDQAIRLACRAVETGVTHFHAHFGTSATAVARLASYFSGIPYTFTAHAKDIFHETVQPDDFQRKLKDAKAIVTVSDYNLRYLQAQYGEAAAQVQRIYNGLDLSQFQYASPQNRPPKIVAVGRLVEKKGFQDLITACGLLTQIQPHFSCQIIGHGDLAGALQAQIDQAGLQPWVELVGAKPQAELKQVVQEAAVLATPCVVGADGNRDGLPTVLLEAMALGTPCVSTDVTGIPEVVRHGVTGLIVPQHDPSALAQAIAQLLRDDQCRVTLAAQARSLIEAQFDIHQNAAQLRRLFQQFPASERSLTTPDPKALQEVHP
ncbi:MAG: glycosyltransferase family 4 protein [Thermosynechococcaceae cyanobacterium MS004]|nr:glycosyltransferase family 4 protein [Thermosynechococcaceae cyanobacterium MS004]